MSYEYDLYLKQHRANVRNAYIWFMNNLSDLLTDDMHLNIMYAHDYSKNDPEEYIPYDAYFYGNNRSYSVVEEYNMAWLKHIHKNPHHWQYWILQNDDPNEGEVVLEMDKKYVIEMICDWWSFSWSKGNLNEIFSWYKDRENYIKLHPKTRKLVEDILARMKDIVEFQSTIEHHGVKGQKWGVRKDEKSNGLKNSAGQDIIVVNRVETSGPPNGVTQVVRKHGGIYRNYYDENGRQKTQVSNHDHGQPKQHPYGEHGEHAHDYVYDNGKLIDRPTRELNDQERKDNGDFL